VATSTSNCRLTSEAASPPTMSLRAGVLHSSRLYTSGIRLRTNHTTNAALIALALRLAGATFSTTGCRTRWGDHNNDQWNNSNRAKGVKSDGQQSVIRRIYPQRDGSPYSPDERRPIKLNSDSDAREVNNESFYSDRQQGYTDGWSTADSGEDDGFKSQGRRDHWSEQRAEKRAETSWQRRATKPPSQYRHPPSTRYFTAPKKGKHVRAQNPFSVLRHDREVLVIYADGACIYNHGNPAAGIGVWFGPDSPHNISRRLGPDEVSLENPQDPTNWERANRASELWAILEGLRELRRADPEERSVVVATDNHYVFRCVTEWVYGWRKNGWQPVDVSGEVLNRDLLETVDKTVRDMESQGWWVRFWSVPKGKNQGPTELANMAVGKGKKGKKVIEKAKEVKEKIGAENSELVEDGAETAEAPRRRSYI
jgi:ribonuclease HI